MNAKKNKAYLNWFIFTVLLTCATFLTSFFSALGKCSYQHYCSHSSVICMQDGNV